MHHMFCGVDHRRPRAPRIAWGTTLGDMCLLTLRTIRGTQIGNLGPQASRVDGGDKLGEWHAVRMEALETNERAHPPLGGRIGVTAALENRHQRRANWCATVWPGVQRRTC